MARGFFVFENNIPTGNSIFLAGRKEIQDGSI